MAVGPVFHIQIATLIAIIASIVFWVWFYRRNGIGPGTYLVPLALWAFFGTLDILVTAKGVLADLHGEGNPLAAAIFHASGYYGPVAASILWVALWAGLVLVLNRLNVRGARLLSLSIFYSLAVGHFLGFSGWFMPLCGVVDALPDSLHLAIAVLGGMVLGISHHVVTCPNHYNFRRA